MEKQIIEAALFMSPKPLKVEEIGKIAGINSLGFVKQILEELKKDYGGRGIELVQTPEGWQLQARQDILPKVAHLSPYADLSEGCKRTLALVAYREPVKQAEIIRIQGNKAYSYVKQLEKMGLVRGTVKGNTKILGLTKEFDAYFGEEKDKIKARLASAFEQWQRKAQQQKAETHANVIGGLQEAEHMAVAEEAEKPHLSVSEKTGIEAAEQGKMSAEEKKPWTNEGKEGSKQPAHRVITSEGEKKIKSVTVPLKAEDRELPEGKPKEKAKAKFEKESEEMDEEEYI